ncbi:MAG TPA: phosphopantothenoylcysteine decarboxylase [Candidatus Dormibacteraeota bacterium]|nr:phosphopantothenoylcysteine decarboxylase [Candidatus Dormibacteraeota bacterium]
MPAGPEPIIDGVRVVVTAGGTREPIDPVRFIGNRSSGKMGNELAAAAIRQGATVTLVTTGAAPAALAGLEVVPVETADEMHAAVRAALAGARVLIMAAAVADWRPRQVAAQKLKKGADTMTLELVPTVDILRALRADDAAGGVFVVGFAAETEHVIDNARAKLESKRLDLVVVNDVSQAGIGMGADDNEVTIIGRDGSVETVARAPKAIVADAIVRIIASRLR